MGSASKIGSSDILVVPPDEERRYELIAGITGSVRALLTGCEVVGPLELAAPRSRGRTEPPHRLVQANALGVQVRCRLLHVRVAEHPLDVV